MAKNTRAEQTTQVATLLPSPPDVNSPISASNHRTVNNDFIDSVLFLKDDNITNNTILSGGDGSLEYTTDPTGAWDGSIIHDLKIPTKKWVQDNAGATPITDGFIPKGTALSDGIEDSNIKVEFTDSGADQTLLRWFSGVNTTKRLVIQGGDAETDDLRLIFEQGSTTSYAEMLAAANLGIKIDGVSATTAVTRIGNIGNNNQQVLFVNRTGAGDQYFTSMGGVRFFGQKFGPGGNQLDQNATDSYGFMATNTQRVVIGTSFASSNENAHLTINSNSGSPTPLPHLFFKGGIDEGVLVPSDNTLYLSSNSSVLEARESGTSYKLVITQASDVPDIPAYPNDGASHVLTELNGVLSWV